MFFILSKTVSYLTMPMVIICMCLLLSVILTRPNVKRKLLYVGILLLLFFSNDFIANEVMTAWEPKGVPYAEMQKYELGIVLSGVTIAERTPADRVYFQRGADRVVHAVELYKLGIVKRLLVSGGSGRLVDIGERESDDIKKAMVLMGVPPEDILVENESRNTHESSVAVKTLLVSMSQSPQACVLITSAFHMRRSDACFRKQGLVMQTFPTDFYNHPRNFYPDTLLVPKPEAMMMWNKMIREWVGLVAYKLADYV